MAQNVLRYNVVIIGKLYWFSRSRYVLKWNKKLSIQMKRIDNTTMSEQGIGVDVHSQQVHDYLRLDQLWV